MRGAGICWLLAALGGAVLAAGRRPSAPRIAATVAPRRFRSRTQRSRPTPAWAATGRGPGSSSTSRVPSSSPPSRSRTPIAWWSTCRRSPSNCPARPARTDAGWSRRSGSAWSCRAARGSCSTRPGRCASTRRSCSIRSTASRRGWCSTSWRSIARPSCATSRSRTSRGASRSRRKSDREPAAGAPADGRPVIVLDPGHGGLDTGTTAAAGETEKAIVLEFAHQLREKLEKIGQVPGRHDALRRQLRDRFPSVCASRAPTRRRCSSRSTPTPWAAARRRYPRGDVYTVSETASDTEAARLAEAENKADVIAGVDLSAEPDEVADILIDLAQRETKTFSAQFARTLVGELKTAARLHKHPLKSAGFKVLKAPDVPSVLVELGYVSSPHDLKLMTSEAWRQRARPIRSCRRSTASSPPGSQGGRPVPESGLIARVPCRHASRSGAARPQTLWTLSLHRENAVDERSPGGCSEHSPDAGQGTPRSRRRDPASV